MDLIRSKTWPVTLFLFVCLLDVHVNLLCDITISWSHGNVDLWKTSNLTSIFLPFWGSRLSNINILYYEYASQKKTPIFSLLWSCPYYSTCSSVSLLKLFIAFSVCVRVYTLTCALMHVIVHVLGWEDNLCKSVLSFYHVISRTKLKSSGLEASDISS